MVNEADSSNRRPMKTRSRRWVAAAGRVMLAMGLGPNLVSVASVLMAAFAAACILAVAYTEPSSSTEIALWIGAAIFIQLRLFCNMMDGILAVEGGLQSKTGEIYNELPDRISDVLIIVPVGYAIAYHWNWAPELSWIAGSFALLTAYIRAMGASTGVGHFFGGPMAKPHRMFTLTVACIGTAFEFLWNGDGELLLIALSIIALGGVITCIRRTAWIARRLAAA